MSKNSDGSASLVKDELLAESPKKEKKRFETAVTILTVIVALFGVGQYFYDTTSSRANSKKERSISYIQQYADSSLLGARQDLADFWVGQPDLVGVFRSKKMSSRSYAALLEVSVFRSSKDTIIRKPLLKIDNFFTQVGFCRSSGLCNPELLDAYFCDTARKYTFVYSPFFSKISELTGDTGIGHELARYAEFCYSSPTIQ
ncbi:MULTISPECIES: hypothetical protein [Falsihalocynthiibacter]|uniref:hypothetical protein n=1 Tax=Falsihalocynthiibacter TaxID=2854182 RepID=UPI0030022BA7